MQDLLPQEIRKQIPPLYAQEGTPDPIVTVKFFTPAGPLTWFITEFSDENGDTLFGYIYTYGEGEFGYFSLSELRSKRSPIRLQNAENPKAPALAGWIRTVERDEDFTPKPLSEAKAEYLKSIGRGESEDESSIE